MLKIGQILGNRYEILGKIGSGGMSDVYKALDKTLNRNMAIKVLKNEYAQDATFVARFRMEAQSAACLSNTNIVNIYDVCEEDNIHYIVMEYIDGITLQKYIDRRGKLGIREVIEVALQVSYGLEAAHAEHIVHRDIKPQNIMISKEGKVYVTDFGIARASTSQTVGTSEMGSAYYFSPEQAKGAKCDERSDIYSLGITMYQMLTGRVPYEGDSAVAVALLHIQGEMVPPSEYEPLIPISLEKIVLKCTAKNPEDRYASASDLISDLRRSLTSPNEDFVELAAPATATASAATAPETAKASETSQVADNGGTRVVDTKDVKKAVKEAEEKKALKEAEIRYQTAAKEEPVPEELDDDDDDFDDDEEIDEKELRFEKIVTYIGIGIAVLVVAVLLFVGIKACDIFSTGSSTETTTGADVEMISLLGMTYDEATDALDKLGLNIKATYGENDAYAEGEIYEQDVTAGTMIPSGTIINVTISNGTVKITIPEDLEKLSPEVVLSTLKSKGFTNVSSTFSYENSEEITEGLVIRTNPASGTAVPADEKITIIVSAGKETVTINVPDVTNMTEDDARDLIKSKGFYVGTVTEEASDEISAGKVIRQTPSGGSPAEEGTTIDLVISTGNDKTTVPNLLGLSKNRAIDKLEAAGLELGEIDYEYCENEDKDYVIGQSKESGAEVKKGTCIDIVIGLGEENPPDTEASDEEEDPNAEPSEQQDNNENPDEQE